MPNFIKHYGDTEGPLGLPMKSEQATALEEVLKGLNSDCRGLMDASGGMLYFKTVPEKFELLEGERADVSLVTTDSVDRDKEVILPQGGDWKSFQKGGGIVTFAHNYQELPVGRALWVKRVVEPANGWLAKTKYTERPEGWNGDWFPDAVFHFVSEGMRGKSIGFIPTEVSPPSEKDLAAFPAWASVRYVIRKWVALEYAVAPIQANPDAVTIAVSKARQKGLAFQTVLDAMDIVIPEGPPEPIVVKNADKGEGEEAKAFDCECLKCGHKMTTDTHCRELPCPECGGEMRRAERPGPGKSVDEPTAPLISVISETAAAQARTPNEITKELEMAALQAVGSLDIDAIAADVIDRMRGKV